ncbi:glycoside hydrolase family 99-like domain-containing protein [Flavobacterium faecale]|uniref:glycosyltransferase WbsX family protein n=1 Tax=Flavobacterium faecale TaxID=1355330 RepID=UPI003AAC8839
MSSRIQFLAYYLPQFHPIPENDNWWGKGFTEWTNVTKAKPLFKGHYQPILPADLGFYDLRVPEVQIQQAELAKEYGVDGFIYYQYWFGNGKMLLERPAESMLKNKKIDIPFCFCWANETWKGIWHGLDNPDVLMRQTYQGEQGYRDYFNYLTPFFKDERYIKVDNKPMFHVFRLDDIPDLKLFINVFNEMAIECGFEGVYFVATGNVSSMNVLENESVYGVVGVDIFNDIRYNQKTYFDRQSILGRIENKIYTIVGYTNGVGKRLKPLILDYAKGVEKLNVRFPHKKYISCVFPNWDNSARSGKKSLIFKNALPQAWQNHLTRAVNELKKNKTNPQFIILKSWNEWGEGNHLEPDQKFGFQRLEIVKKVKAGL